MVAGDKGAETALSLGFAGDKGHGGGKGRCGRDRVAWRFGGRADRLWRREDVAAAEGAKGAPTFAEGRVDDEGFAVVFVNALRRPGGDAIGQVQRDGQGCFHGSVTAQGIRRVVALGEDGGGAGFTAELG